MSLETEIALERARRAGIVRALGDRWALDPFDPCDDLLAEIRELNARAARRPAFRTYTRAEVLDLMGRAYRRDLDREGSMEELLDEFGGGT